MRELLWMLEGHERNIWQHTSVLVASMFNSSGNMKKGKKMSPMDVYPFRDRRDETIDGSIELLKVLIPKGKRDG